MNRPRPPGGSQPPAHLATQDRLQMLQQQVAQKYGAFGSRPPEEELDRKVLQDDFLKPTLQIIAGIFVASAFAYFASSPKFSAPGTWANSFRLDTALIVFWGPLLYWIMARQKLSKSLR